MASSTPQESSFDLSSVEAPDSTADDRSSHHSAGSESGGHSLPPTDGGKGAWLALAGSCVVQAPVWGFSLTAGVFQSYYTTHAVDLDLAGDVATTALIGTTLTGLLYLSSPILFTLLTRYPSLRPWSGPVGLIILAASLLASSFTTVIPALIATQGVLQAVGAALLYAPSTLYLDEWFAARRGLAYGIMGAAKSATGVALPLAAEPALARFGYVTVVRAWAVGAVLLAAPLLHYVRPRIPPPRSASAPRRLDLRFARHPAFWVPALGNILQSLGYFLPTAYLPGYAAEELGLGAATATALLAALNGLSVLGSATFGVLGDRVGVGRAVLLSAGGSAVAVLLFWGLASHAAVLAMFAVIYGFFAGGFSSTWSGVLTELQRECPEVETGFVYGLLAGGRGIGNVVSGPLSVSLMHADLGKAAGGYGSQYGPLILFTGASAVLGGVGSMYKVIKTGTW